VSTEAFIYDAIRTPRGRGKNTGSLHGTKPISLVVGLIDELRKRNPTLDVDRVSDLLLGVVSPPACRTPWVACSSTDSARRDSRP
jgi:acetyl-CoA C-acetyltransferase